MLIIGVDPGLANSGYGVIRQEGQKLECVTFGTILTGTETTFPKRLLSIHEHFDKLLDLYKPDACAVESIFFAKNAKSAFQVGHGRAVFILSAAIRGVEVYEYTPLQVKKALVGVGRAEKPQVQYMTKMLLNLKEIPEPDHAADALAIAICHANSSRFGQAIGVDSLVYGKKGGGRR